MNNYIPIRKRSLTKCSFLFVDASENLAHQLFKKNGLKYKLKGHFVKEGEKYALPVCIIRKKDKQLFFDTMEELERKLLIMGYNDYSEFCESIFSGLEAVENGV